MSSLYNNIIPVEITYMIFDFVLNSYKYLYTNFLHNYWTLKQLKSATNLPLCYVCRTWNDLFTIVNKQDDSITKPPIIRNWLPLQFILGIEIYKSVNYLIWLHDTFCNNNQQNNTTPQLIIPNTPLLHQCLMASATRTNQLQILIWLHTQGCNISHDVIYIAAAQGYVEIIQWAINLVDQSRNDQRMIRIAIENNQLDVLNWVLGEYPHYKFDLPALSEKYRLCHQDPKLLIWLKQLEESQLICESWSQKLLNTLTCLLFYERHHI